jgi:hypothetical protein
MLWEQHNSRVITSMGMAWDTGAPMWPFQTPDILLVVIDAPAYVFAMPISDSLGLRTVEGRHPVLLLAIVLLWFCVGWLTDFGFISRSLINWRKCLIGAFAAVALVSLYIGGYCAVEGARWWSRYGGLSLSKLLTLGRLVGPVPWCVLILLVLTRATFQLLRLN